MTVKFKMGFNGTEPALFLTTKPTAPASVYDGKFFLWVITPIYIGVQFFGRVEKFRLGVVYSSITISYYIGLFITEQYIVKVVLYIASTSF